MSSRLFAQIPKKSNTGGVPKPGASSKPGAAKKSEASKAQVEAPEDVEVFTKSFHFIDGWRM